MLPFHAGGGQLVAHPARHIQHEIFFKLVVVDGAFVAAAMTRVEDDGRRTRQSRGQLRAQCRFDGARQIKAGNPEGAVPLGCGEGEPVPEAVDGRLAAVIVEAEGTVAAREGGALRVRGEDR